MPSTDYYGQQFSIGSAASSLDDSELAQEFSPIVFASSLDDSETAQQLPAVQFSSDFVSDGGAVVLTYKMYGYCTVHNTFESWISIGSPNPSPPIGHAMLADSVSYVIL